VLLDPGCRHTCDSCRFSWSKSLSCNFLQSNSKTWRAVVIIVWSRSAAHV